MCSWHNENLTVADVSIVYIEKQDENDAGDVQAGEDDEEEDVMDLI